MISAVVVCKNEKENIEECLKSLSFCDEILVIDDYSNDQTINYVKKIKNSKIKIVEYSLKNNFSNIRNFGLRIAKGEWVLFVDADERVTSSLAYEISNAVIFSSEFNGFYIRRKDIMWGKELKHGESGSIKLLRLAKKEFGGWEGEVHERWHIKGKVGKLNNLLLHFPHKTIKDFLLEINFYTSIRANELFKKGVKANAVSIFLYPAGKFILNFVIRRGFLDGIQGFIFAIIMSLHSFLVRGKLWTLNNKS